MDANRRESEAGSQFQDVLPNRSIRVHWRPFAVDLNSYGADGSLKTRIANQISSREPKIRKKTTNPKRKDSYEPEIR